MVVIFHGGELAEDTEFSYQHSTEPLVLDFALDEFDCDLDVGPPVLGFDDFSK